LNYFISQEEYFVFILGEFPSFTNGLTLTNIDDEDSSQVHETTVNTIPIIWGPPKRK
jgi:hypothetical protein